MACAACPAGHISAAGAASCAVCAAGTFASSNATVCTPCPPGSHCNAGISYPCSAGTFSAVNGATSCSPCDSGTFSASGAQLCVPCTAGYFWNAVASGCVNCPAGSKCANGVRQSCPGGTGSRPGASSCDGCSMQGQCHGCDDLFVCGSYTCACLPSGEICARYVYDDTPIVTKCSLAPADGFGRYCAYSPNYGDPFCSIGFVTPGQFYPVTPCYRMKAVPYNDATVYLEEVLQMSTTHAPQQVLIASTAAVAAFPTHRTHQAQKLLRASPM